MNRATVFVAVFVACAPAAILACSGSTPNAGAPQDGGADATEASCGHCAMVDGSPEQDATVDGGAETDSSIAEDVATNADTGAATDGGADSASVGDAADASFDASTRDAAIDSGPADSAAPDAALPPTPGIVSCGATTCAVPSTECCIDSTGTGTCMDAGTACGINTAAIQCNETPDCPANQVCCLTATADGGVEVTAACQTGACATAQACRTNGECGSNGSCVVQECGNLTFELCGLQSLLGQPCTAE